jgi:hypothetical protein
MPELSVRWAGEQNEKRVSGRSGDHGAWAWRGKGEAEVLVSLLSGRYHGLEDS